ncbi:hypothetical protein ALTERO38_60359 [Alteromonas sp. 38]|nr:hypothetical protein ALTER154_40435 [Alteromonas sp. 154]VXC19015.1 hypothetical protein ALTERO38_60359 [Alteromonas sp. 38]
MNKFSYHHNPVLAKASRKDSKKKGVRVCAEGILFGKSTLAPLYFCSIG